MRITEVWECPRCGTQQGIGLPARFTKPPVCQFGHSPVEMEQKAVQALGRQEQER